MANAKQRVTEIIQQPADNSHDETCRELAFIRMVERGLEDSRSGRILSDEETARRIRLRRKWEEAE